MAKSPKNVKTITGYTATEVGKILSNLNLGENFNFEEVKKLSGCNPLLISHLEGCSNMDEYAQRVQHQIDSFIDNNLSVVKDVHTVSEFFASYKWDAGRHHIHVAMQEQKFSEEEYKSYQTTWSCDNHNLKIQTC